VESPFAVCAVPAEPEATGVITNHLDRTVPRETSYGMASEWSKSAHNMPCEIIPLRCHFVLSLISFACPKACPTCLNPISAHLTLRNSTFQDPRAAISRDFPHANSCFPPGVPADCRT